VRLGTELVHETRAMPSTSPGGGSASASSSGAGAAAGAETPPATPSASISGAGAAAGAGTPPTTPSASSSGAGAAAGAGTQQATPRRGGLNDAHPQLVAHRGQGRGGGSRGGASSRGSRRTQGQLQPEHQPSDDNSDVPNPFSAFMSSAAARTGRARAHVHPWGVRMVRCLPAEVSEWLPPSEQAGMHHPSALEL
jgi:hypothetical protein